MKNNKDSRRTFIKKSAAGVIGASFTFSASSYANILGANDRVNVAVIGLHGRGKAHLSAINSTVNTRIRAICDVDSRELTKTAELVNEMNGQKPDVIVDIRKLLENKDIDAVTIATPDHWHAPMAIMAMQAGMHVYLEKPCCFNPQEGNWLIQSQKKHGKVLQVGNQQRSAPTSVQAVADIRAGIIGEAYMGKAWYANTRGSIGTGKNVTVPDWLDWDMWQGPAPHTDYRDNIVHYNWHWFWRWGTGEINNNGFHELDICRWALGVDYPSKITSSGGRYSFDDDWKFYDTQIASFEFGNDKMISWEGRSCNGFNFHERGRGATIHGTKGTVLLDRNGYWAYDNSGKLFKQVLERGHSASTDIVGIGALDLYHMENFVEAIRSDEKLNSPIEEAVKSNMMCHLGNIAQKFNRTLQTDPRDGKIMNDKEAMKLWSRDYAEGWKPVI
ncbi:MAG: Gfo/Idh/MocA family oxidoreductase [Bacteroidetes bacterium]|nr:Gfo/Idh/MocA family oxidoreductase [Bacteroidota bacterium]